MFAKLTIDRATRDELREELEYEGALLEGFDAVVRECDREEAVRLYKKAGFVIELLDMLGWGQESDRDEYEITTDREPLVKWLARRNSEIKETIGGDTLSLRRQEQGDEGEFYTDCSPEESIARTREEIDRAVYRAQVFTDLLRRLSPHWTAAAQTPVAA